MANYVSKHTGAQIDAAVDKTGELEGKVSTLTEEMTELKESGGGVPAEVVAIIEAMPAEIYEPGGNQSTSFDPEWKNVTLSNVDGSESESDLRISTRFIPVGQGIVGTLDPAVSNVSYWVRVYNAEKVFINNATLKEDGTFLKDTAQAYRYNVIVDNIVDVIPAAAYIRIVARKDDGTYIVPVENGLVFTVKVDVDRKRTLDEIYERKLKGKYSETDIVFSYPVTEGVSNVGYLKLPPNYTIDGTPVPLIVFVHGSADIPSINSTAMTDNYNEYYNFLRDSGYAVFDCYGYGTKYTSTTGGSSNTWGLPINRQCYAAGIRYVCEKYNVDIDNVFVSCKSLGGIQALSMFYDDGMPIKAVGMLAPELDPLNVNMGYNEANKRTIAAELGFSEDTGNVLAFNQNDAVPAGFWDYITANMDKWVGHFAFFTGLPIKASEKPTYYGKDYNTGDMCRTSLNRPVKIWVAEDDNAVSYNVCRAFIQSLNNGGYKGELRTMPSGTGQHHSVDNDPNAPQTTNVTTKCGIPYVTVPTAYYELVQFFDKYCHK